jgi:hypothetical protein
MKNYPSRFAMSTTLSLFIGPSRKMLAQAFLTLASVLGLFVAAQADTPVNIVGEATLVIGNATLVSADGKQRAMERGTEVRVGDRVETQPGGHVHLRFVDGGRVSVRPVSRLVIESYAYSKDQPQLSGIKFRLDEGVIRSITGQWGEAAKERFRLNTPVAAIGVKGTDFVVRSESTGTAATVFSGAIVLSPLTGQCMGSFGPCLNGSEKTLTEAMKGQMLELLRPEAMPQLVPAVDLQAAAKAQMRLQSGTPDPAAKTQPVIAAAAEPVRNDTVEARPLISESRAVDAVNKLDLPAPQVKELTWGRYAWAPAMAGDDYSKQFEFALLQGRQSLGGNGAFSLLRTQAEADVFAPIDSGAKFRMASASATVVRTDNQPNETVQVGAGVLDVNFARSTFATQLQTQASSAGAQTIQASGTINANGTMRADAGNSFLLGGFNNNGKEAAYLFQKMVPNGVLMGTTLWGR